MSFKRELEEARVNLHSNKITERRKAIEKFTNLLRNEQVPLHLNSRDPFSWNDLLEDSQNYFKRESDRVQEIVAKKGPLKCEDANFIAALEFVDLVVETAIKEGVDNIDLSLLIRYIEGCLREKGMRSCKDTFLTIIKNRILLNHKCLGYLEPDDFIVIFNLLKSELEKCSTISNNRSVFSCLSVLIKKGPLAAFPTRFLREQFNFISKLVQSVGPNKPRPQQEDVMEIVLNFCKHTAEDNRLSCIKLGEEIFHSLLDLYCVSGHDSLLKVNFIEFCLFQIVIHNPDGVPEGNPGALAFNWTEWKSCVRRMYILVTKEISQYLRQSVKNTLFFMPIEKSNVIAIMDNFLMLFVEVCKQIINSSESTFSTSSLDDIQLSTQTHNYKKRKIETSLESIVAEIQETKSFIWVKLVGALLKRYPKLIGEKLFVNLLQILHCLQLEVNDSNTMSCIYETQTILIDINRNFEISNEINNLWKLIGDSTLRAVGLNQNIKETQNLLQKLINHKLVDIVCVLQTYTSGVLSITQYHLDTLVMVLEQISELEISKKEELFNSLLSPQNVKDYRCFLKRSFAEILVTLTLKQCPNLRKLDPETSQAGYNVNLVKLYEKQHFEITKLDCNKSTIIPKRSFNVDLMVVNLLEQKLTQFAECAKTETIDKILCIVGLLYNILSCLIDYEIIRIENDSKYVLLIRKLLNSDCIMSLEKYQVHSDKMMKHLLHISEILDEIFSLNNSVTSVVKEMFTIEFLKQVVAILNFFQDVTIKRAGLEHQVKMSLTGALSKYSFVSNVQKPSNSQRLILLSLARPDYDFNTESDYDLAMAFLNNIKLARTEYLPEEIIQKILDCLQELSTVTYRSYKSAQKIISFLTDIYRHLVNVDDSDCKTSAVALLQPFYSRLTYYGPNIAIELLNAIEVLCKVDSHCGFTKWNNKDIIKFVPEFLTSDFQMVRYRAIEVLVEFFKALSCTTELTTIHRLEELFDLIYQSNIEVFEVQGLLSEERRQDEIIFRASSALYTFLCLIVNCNGWVEESLFALIKLEHSKKLYEISNGELLKKVFYALEQHFGTKKFMEKYLEIVLSKWIEAGYNINNIQFNLLGCTDKKELYLKYFDTCLPILLKLDKSDLFAVAKEMKMSEKDVFERCCSKIFARSLSRNSKNIDNQFIQKNVEVSYFCQILGPTFKDYLLKDIDQVIFSLIGNLTDPKNIEQILGVTTVFTSKGISYDDFNKCLHYIENLLCNSKNLISFLSKNKKDKIQKILLNLQYKVYNCAIEQQLKCFHQFAIFNDLVIKTLPNEFFLRDTIYFLVHLIQNCPEIGKAILSYIKYFLKNILPENSKEFQQFVTFVVNSLKNIAIENEHLLPPCIEILEFIIIDNARALLTIIEKLDTFPPRPEFNNIRNIHNNIKYGNKIMSLRDEIILFLDNNDIATRQDSLIHLKSILSKEKLQLKLLYDDLSKIRGFSEDCEQSLLHKLTSMLIKMSCYPNDNISHEAIKCLGELGPADLTTIVLEPEKRVLDIHCPPLELLTGHVVSLLVQYIIDPDIEVVRAASDALYEILKFKEGKRVIDSSIDFGYGSIHKEFITPYMENLQKLPSQIKIKQLSVDVSELWCPSQPIDNNTWITSLVLHLLNLFNDGCYLKYLITVCKVKAKFCEHILPLLIYVLLSLNNGRVTEMLSVHINRFFTNHYNLSSGSEKLLIAVNKKSVKVMLDVINFIRQQPSILKKLEDLKLNYLSIAKAATFCSAHFSAILYAELWCQQQNNIIELNKSKNEENVEDKTALLDYIYYFVSQELGITIQQILQTAYKSIGELDALSGCGTSSLLHPEHRIEYHKNLGEWNKVMNYYRTYPCPEPELLIESFKMNHMYELPLLCDNLSTEPQYECLWRLGQWHTNKKANVDKRNPDNYEKYKFTCLKALCNNDKYIFTSSINQLSQCIISNLKHISLESSNSLYPIFSQLQSLIEMEDCSHAIDTNNFDEILLKWKNQDLIIRKNDFQFVEPIVAQRMTILRELTKNEHSLNKKYFNMVLDFADYAKTESRTRVAETALINIRKSSYLEDSVKYELQLRETQLAWSNNEKKIAQLILRKLCNADNDKITKRLKAFCLKLQGVYKAETYSDRASILTCFEDSIELYMDMRTDNKTWTNEDRENLEDAFDKMATFADKEYQQILKHMKSDLFQQKQSNINSCKQMARAMNVTKAKSEDERKAQIIHERQLRIDESEMNTTYKEKEQVLALAARYYIRNLISCDTNNIRIFRLMALFLENRDNNVLLGLLRSEVQQIPSYKFIPILPQLVPHIATTDTFGHQINRIIEKCAFDHPHHTLPLLLALVNANKDRQYSKSKTKVGLSERSEAALILIKRLIKKSNLLGKIIEKMLKLSDGLIELAYFVNSNSSDSSDSSNDNNEITIPSRLKIHKIKDFEDVLVPTYNLPVSKSNTYDNIVGIVKFKPKYKSVGGINAPKRIECHSTDGKTHSQLIKGQDDLRQDAVMQQVFTIMTNLLSANKQTKSLLIRTYKIVPLSMRSGILEWVDNSMPIGEYLVGGDFAAHKKFRPNDMSPGSCKAKLKNCAGKSLEEKLGVYNSICEDFRPVFHKFFETNFRQPSVWYERKRAYIHSVATTSMCGYILGIGDRHLSNILIDKQTAEVIHIDFGIAFDQGKCLPTPETIPFRLSRDIVDGMGVSGTEGLFRKSCEKTVEVLRSNSQTILTILEVLLYDPLYFWTVSAAEAQKRQTDDNVTDNSDSDECEDESKNISAERALLRLRGKLQGTEEQKPISIEQQVGNLIQQAVDPVNLCRLYYGWQPYV